MEWLFRSDYAQAPVSVHLVILSLLLAFLSGQALAWTYMFTHWGLSYSRTFVNSLVLIPVITSAVMMVLANSLVTAFGMMAVFAIVRFRNILRDTLDTAYILCCLVMGMAAGTQRYPIAVIVCLVVILIMLYLHFTAFGSRHRYDVIVNLHMEDGPDVRKALDLILWKYCKKVRCASERTSGAKGVDLSYRVLMRDPARVEEMVDEIRKLPGLSNVNFVHAEDESEL